MTFQTEAPVKNLNVSNTNRPIHDLVGQYLAGYIDIDPPYQRGSVWTEEQRILLIKSWLYSLPIPSLVINQRFTPAWQKIYGKFTAEDANYAVIDGKQRFETALLWYGDQLKVPASWFPTNHIESTIETGDGPYVKFKNLTIVGQRFTKHDFLIPVAESKVSSIEAEAEIYLLVNGTGTLQSPEDINRAKEVANGRRIKK